jgi:hypothetical protein
MKSWRFLAITLVLAACSDDPVETDPPLNIDRPLDVAFACGRDGAVVPLADCAAASTRPLDTVDDNDTDTSDDAYTLFFFAFALESETGTLAITRYPALRDAPAFTDEIVNGWNSAADPIDVDPLTPRVNGIAVGATPVAVTTDRDACHLVTANAGSCDLSVVDVKGLFAATSTNLSSRVAVVDAAGQPVLAKAAAMAAEPSTTPAGTALTCPAAPTGLVYVAYPGCHTVAAVRPATGQIEAHIDFAADGTATIVRDGNLACPAECGASAPATPGARPSTLDLLADPRTVVPRLAIGAEDSNRVTIVDLDATFLPTAARQVTLEGDIGIIDVALTPTMAMGGSDGVPEAGDDLGGDAQFVYAVATDTTVRVAEISQATPVECDTQIDPRYLGNVTDVSQLSCLPVGSPSLPRRAGALGPGIELTGAAIPTAVTVVRNAAIATQFVDDVPNGGDDKPDVDASPEPTVEGRRALIGTFAFVASSIGAAFVVNIDDDSYPDLEDPANPLAIELTQALPHSLRDQVESRSSVPTAAHDHDKNAETPAVLVPSCSVAEPDPEAADPIGGSRQAGLIARQSDTSTLATDNLEFSPGIRHVACVGQKVQTTDNTLVPDVTTVSELAFQAPAEVRAASFPDLAPLPYSHFWRFTWEGLYVDEIRQSLVPVDGFGMRVQDNARPFCSLGVEPYDSVQLIGCDPNRGDFDCGVGETCFVHPDAQTGSAGACLPSGEVDFLAGPCRDFLVSRRRYAVAQAEAGQLKLTERRRVLRTTPLSGCTSELQCDALARHEGFMAVDKDPFERTAEDEPDKKNWACEPDPSRAGTINRCVQRCNDDLPRDTIENEALANAATCEAGNICAFKGTDGWGRCVEGVVPPLQCVRGRQRYVLRATDAFVITHTPTGNTSTPALPALYDHAIVADGAGACVRDPAANPVKVSRVPLRPAPCTGDASSPNPCLTQVTNREEVPIYVEGGEVCDTDASRAERQTDRTPRDRLAEAIRVQLPGFTTHIVDPTYPGDAVCRGDRQGGLVDVPYVALGTQLSIRISSGFSPHTITTGSLVYPVNIVRGPDNTVWLVDEGKHVSDSYRGGLVRHNPATGFNLQIE